MLLGAERFVHRTDLVLRKRCGRLYCEFGDALTRGDERLSPTRGEPVRHLIGVTHRRGEAETLNAAPGQGLETGKPDAELPAAFGGGEVVNLVHHHRFDAAQHGTEVLAAEHQLEGFRGGHEQIGRVACLFGSLRLGGVAVANINPKAHGFCQFGQAAIDVPVQRPQRRDVEDGHGRPGLGQAPMKERQDAGHRFPGPGRGDDEAVVTLHHVGQHVFLNGRGLPALFFEGFSELWMKPGKHA